jgi:hypothetical protein
MKSGWEANFSKLPPNTRWEEWNGDRAAALMRIEQLARSRNRADFPTQGGGYVKITIGGTLYGWDDSRTFNEEGIREKEMYLLRTYGTGDR